MRRYKTINCSYEGCGVTCKSGKKGLCPKHYAQLMRETSAKRKKALGDKVPTKRQVETNRRRISKKLDILFSRLVKTIYPFECHGKCCRRPLKKEEAQCCHFVGRRKVLLRWFLGNALPGCAKCNLSDQDHVYFLGVNLNEYYGEGFAESVSNAGKRNTVKLDISQLEDMQKIFSDALKNLNEIGHLSNREQKLFKKQLREEIIRKTKYF